MHCRSCVTRGSICQCKGAYMRAPMCKEGNERVYSCLRIAWTHACVCVWIWHSSISSWWTAPAHQVQPVALGAVSAHSVATWHSKAQTHTHKHLPYAHTVRAHTCGRNDLRRYVMQRAEGLNMTSIIHRLEGGVHFDLIGWRPREREREIHVVPAVFMTDVIGTHKW